MVISEVSRNICVFGIGEGGEGKSIMNLRLRVFTLDKKQGARFEFYWAQRGDTVLGKNLEPGAEIRSRAQAEKGAQQGPVIHSRSHHFSAALSTGYCAAFL